VTAHKKPKGPPGVVGWREWVALPELGVTSIKAKVDTGARTSSLHAYDVEVVARGGRERVRFKLHPEQRDAHRVVACEAPLVEWRQVRPSNGQSELRPVVVTVVELLGERFEVELTLTRRDAMGFRMLLGRQALRGRFAVDPGRSYLNGRRVKGSRRIKARKDRSR